MMGNVFGYNSEDEKGEILHGRLSHIVELPPQPPDREVNVMFKMKLERDGASTGEIELKLGQWTMEEKWSWVYRTALKPNKPSKGPKLSPSEHVQVLSSPNVSQQGVSDHLDKIRHRAAKGQRRWKQEFTEAGGVTILSTLLPNPRGGESFRNPSPSLVKLYQGALSSLYFLLTLTLATQIFVQCDASMVRLFSCLYVGNAGEIFLKRTLTILRRLSESSQPTYSRVLHHFDLLRLRENEKFRFERLVSIFANQKSSAALKSEVLALINALLVAAPSLEERVKLRRDLCSHGLGIWIDEYLLQTQSTVPCLTLDSNHSSTPSCSPSRASPLAPSLKYQIGLFQASYSSDARQTQYRVVAEGRRAMEAEELSRKDTDDLREHGTERGTENRRNETMKTDLNPAVVALQQPVLLEGVVDLSSTEQIFKALRARASNFQMESLLRCILLYLLSTSMDNLLSVKIWTYAAKMVEKVMRVSLAKGDINDESFEGEITRKRENRHATMAFVADSWTKLHRQIDELEMTFEETRALLDLRDQFQRLLLRNQQPAIVKASAAGSKGSVVTEEAERAQPGRVKAVGAMLAGQLTQGLQPTGRANELKNKSDDDSEQKEKDKVDRKAAATMLNNLFASRTGQTSSAARSAVSSVSGTVDRKVASAALNRLFASRTGQASSLTSDASSSSSEAVNRKAASATLNKLFASRTGQASSATSSSGSSTTEAVDRKAASTALKKLFASRIVQTSSTTPMSGSPGGTQTTPASGTGVSREPETDSDAAANDPEAKGVKVCQHAKFMSYFTMLKAGVPEGGVMQKMVKDGLDPALLKTPDALVDDAGRAIPSEKEAGKKKRNKNKKTRTNGKKQSSQPTKVINERMVGVRTREMEDVPEDLKKYAKLLTMGMPAEHAMLRLSADGVDTEGFDLLIWLNGDAAAADAAASSGSESESGSEGDSESEDEGSSASKTKLKKSPMPSARAVLPTRAPKTKLRPFYWETLDTEQLAGTIWEEIYRQLPESLPKISQEDLSLKKKHPDSITPTSDENTDAVPMEEEKGKGLPNSEAELVPKKSLQTTRSMLEQALCSIDMETLESLFSQVSVTKKGETSKVSGDSKEIADGGHHSTLGLSNNRRLKRRKSFLDPSRANMVAITASNMRIPASKLREKLEDMDIEFLTLEKTQKLLKALPTDEEARAVRSFSGSLDELSESDNFFAELGKIDRVGERLRAIELWHSFPQQVKTLAEQIACQKRACDEIIDSTCLKGIFASILKLGNCLNDGTSRGEAYGFKLCNLSKLIQVKAADKKTTLLHYLAKELRNSNEALVDVSKTMTSVDVARKIQLTQLRFDMKQLRESTTGLKAELQRTSKELEDMDQDQSSAAVAKAKFVETMSALLSTAELELKSLDESFDQMLEHLKKAMAKFGEDSAKLQPEELFSCIFGFATELERVDKENQIALLTELRKQKRKAEAAKRRLQRRSSINTLPCSSSAAAEACEKMPILTRIRRLSTAGPYVSTQ